MQIKETNMAKAKTVTPADLRKSQIQLNMAIRGVIENETTLRREVISSLLNKGKNINYECGYPGSITKDNYKALYDREGYAKRVVRILPEESWAEPPEIYETEKETETQFENEWKEAQEKHRIFQYMQRIDCLSGIGRFGLLLLGINDGKNLSEPVDGINLKTGEKSGGTKRELLYLKAIDESVIDILTKESDATSPRYGLPTMYSIKFEQTTGTSTVLQTNKVHWTRVVHIADNRETSEIYGIPRMQSVYNRLLDLRKILSGSAEMFWKGGFPGYAAELDPRLSPEAIQDYILKDEVKDALAEQIEDYFNSMQRVLSISGFTIKSLQPQVADPAGHVETHIRMIAISLGIPYRIFLGTEEAKLASSQDVKTWNKRIMNRQNQYVSPMVIRPVVDRLIALGVLSEPTGYNIEWSNLDALSEQEQADISVKKTEAAAKYVTGGVSEIIPPIHYLTEFLNVPMEQAQQFLDDADLMEKEIDEKEVEEEPVEGDNV